MQEAPKVSSVVHQCRGTISDLTNNLQHRGSKTAAAFETWLGCEHTLNCHSEQTHRADVILARHQPACALYNSHTIDLLQAHPKLFGF